MKQKEEGEKERSEGGSKRGGMRGERWRKGRERKEEIRMYYQMEYQILVEINIFSLF